MSLPLRLAVLVPILGLSIALDQWTKVLATRAFANQPLRSYLGDTFRFTWATNEGAFLSLGSSLPPEARYWVLTVAVGLLLVGIIAYALFGKSLDAWQVAGYALIAAGGVSNWVDRARFNGSVVDFMNMGIGPLRTGIFNVADIYILVGIGIVLIAGSIMEKRAKRAAQAAGAPPPRD